jgi:hypothetical protein
MSDFSKSLFSRLMTLLGLDASPRRGGVFPVQTTHGGGSVRLAESDVQPPAGAPASRREEVRLEPPAPDFAVAPAETGVVTEAVSARIDLDPEAERMLERIRVFYRNGGSGSERQREQLFASFRRTCPEQVHAIEEAVEEGERDCALLVQAYDLARQKGWRDPSVLDLRLLVSARGIPKDRFERQARAGSAAGDRARLEREKRAAGVPLSEIVVREMASSPTSFRLPSPPRAEAQREAFKNLHPNDIRCKKFSAKWSVYIDETGSNFGIGAGDVSGVEHGRVVAVLVPGNCSSLKPLELGWHAVERSHGEIEDALQSLLDSEAGVFGISVSSVPLSRGERWLDAVGLLVDWILRLLPGGEDPVHINVWVEQRRMFKAGHSLELLARESLRRLALAFPMRAALLSLRVQVAGKSHDGFSPYADAVAFTWARGTATSRAQLQDSKLVGTCLLEQNARELLHAWDAFSQGVELPTQRWWELVASPDARTPSSILHTFLERIGGECQVLPQNWNRFLNHVRSQMAAGPVDLKKLGAAVAWLQDHQPEDKEIPPLLRMSWLTVKLAEANHLGQGEVEWEKELAALSEGLLEEAAPMVCHANLHLAVAKTNRYAFDGARQVLQRWLEVPPVVPGLQMWAQVRSSLGQHAAFLGEGSRAVGLFKEAIEGFGRLSDPQQRRKDVEQTGCYLAIAMMDDPAVSDTRVREAVERVTGSLASAAWALGGASDGALRYAHHLFVRWLVRRGDPALADAYCGMRPEWKTGEGHPWPLIQLYRAVLIRQTDPGAAAGLVLDAARLANEARQGPVVRLIGACCRAVGRMWGVEWPTAEVELAALRKALPRAEDRIACLEQGWSRDPRALIPLLERVLPFNFH